MAIRLVNIGTVPNDGTGDPLRVAFDKVNQNFLDLDGSGEAVWGDITGNIASQTDLTLALNNKSNIGHYHTRIEINERTGDQTLAPNDAGKLLYIGGDPIVSLTIPDEGTPIEIGARFEVARRGAGDIVFMGNIETPGILKTSGHAILTKVAPNEWTVLGGEIADAMSVTVTGVDVMVPLRGMVDVVINWGDGNITRYIGDNPTYAYSGAGTRDVSIYGHATSLGVVEPGETPLEDAGEVYDMSFPAVNGWSNTLTHVESLGSIGITSLRGAFLGATNLVEVGRLCQDVEDMSFAFLGSGIQRVGHINLDSATSARGMFAYCADLAEIPPLRSETLTDTEHMFFGAATSTHGLVIDIFFPNVSTAVEMFDGCTGITNVTRLWLPGITDNVSFRNASGLGIDALYRIMLDLPPSTATLDFRGVTLAQVVEIGIAQFKGYTVII